MTDFRVFKPLFLDKGYKNRTTTIKVQKCMSEKKELQVAALKTVRLLTIYPQIKSLRWSHCLTSSM